MGLLKNLVIGGIAGGLLDTVIDSISESMNEKEEKQKKKEETISRFDSWLERDTFDNDRYQSNVDDFIREYAESEDEKIQGCYYKYLGWFKVSSSTSELRNEKIEQWSKEELDANYRVEREADEQCLRVLNEAIKYTTRNTEDFVLYLLYYKKAMTLSFLQRYLESVHCAIRALSYAKDDEEKESVKSIIAGRGKDSGEPYFNGYGIVSVGKDIGFIERLNAFSYDNDNSPKENEEFMEFCGTELQGDIANLSKEQFYFSNRPYHERQFIFTVRDLDHIKGCYDDSDNIKYVFPLDEIPKDIAFPLGHPQPNTLYYAHPLKAVYLPFENAQIQLFYEKIQEMCRLFQCLGATQITARCLKGKKISKDVVSSYNTEGRMGVKVANVSSGYDVKNGYAQNQENRDEMQLVQTFSPKKAPYCPEDLLWVLNDSELQSFVKQRLEGGLLNFTKKVSSYETSSLSQNQVNDVKAAFENMMANVSANYSTSNDMTFSSITETEWEISVEFMPLEDLPAPEDGRHTRMLKMAMASNTIMSVENIVYYTEKGILVKGELLCDIKSGCKVLITDGKSMIESEIAGILFTFDPGWAVLEGGEKGDKVWLQLKGVRADQIYCGMNVYLFSENETEVDDVKLTFTQLDESLTHDEERYKEEILFCLEDSGTISEDDRKYLERKRRKLGISEERARELERQFASSLSSAEQEYLETFKEMCISGTVSERVRRLLDRERESLNITAERAKIIEKMAMENN